MDVGAPVTVSREADLGRLRAVVANAGGSNTGDGERGLQTARATQRLWNDSLELQLFRDEAEALVRGSSR